MAMLFSSTFHDRRRVGLIQAVNAGLAAAWKAGFAKSILTWLDRVMAPARMDNVMRRYL